MLAHAHFLDEPRRTAEPARGDEPRDRNRQAARAASGKLAEASRGMRVKARMMAN